MKCRVWPPQIAETPIRSWSRNLYAFALGFYTAVLTGVSLVAYGLSSLLVKDRWRVLRRFFVTSGVTLLAFVPWIVLLVTQDFTDTVLWWKDSVPVSSLLRGWSLNFGRTVLDVGNEPVAVGICVAVLAGWAFAVCCRPDSRDSGVLLLTLAAVPFLAFAIPDLIEGGRRSLTPRYLLPVYLSVQMAIARLVATKLEARTRSRLWALLLAVLLGVGIASGVAAAPQRVWWHKGEVIARANLRVAEAVGRFEQPLVVSDNFALLSLSYLLAPETRVRLTIAPRNPAPPGTDAVFFYEPSDELRSLLERSLPLEQVENLPLWQVRRSPS